MQGKAAKRVGDREEKQTFAANITVAVFRWVAMLPLWVMSVMLMLLHSVTSFPAVAGYPVAAAGSRVL
jgi:hypothetical protein